MSTIVEVPSALRRPHPYVTATRKSATGLRARDDGRLEIGPKSGVAHLLVSREQLHRALLVLQAVFTEARRCGYEIAASDKSGYGDRAGVAVVIRGHAYTIEISETVDRVPLTEAEINEWEQKYNVRRFAWGKEPKRPQTRGVANGKLRVSLPSRWHGARSNWTEGPRGGLDKKLPELFAELERRAAEDDERAAEAARREVERQREEEKRHERELRLRIENARLARLRGGIEQWRLAQETREYVAALRDRLPDLEPAERERITAWCAWAEQWAQTADPVANTYRVHGLDDERDRYYVSPR
jgi:hypothetical protein